MNTRANNSRERILEVAESIILQKGFAATSIEDVLGQAAITKGGFFYHFKGKKELARALVERYLAEDERVFRELLERADTLTEDPLQRALIFLKLFAEMMAELEANHPGCLVASFTYESQQFNEEVHDLVRRGVVSWRSIIAERLQPILDNYEPRVDTSMETLADMFTACVEGGILLSLIFKDKKYLVEQVLAYRAHLRLVFEP